MHWFLTIGLPRASYHLIKRECIKKRICVWRSDARADIFEYIEMFYNSKRRHGSSEQGYSDQ